MMRQIRRGTTPTIYIKTNADFSDYDTLEITIACGDTQIVHKDSEISFTQRDGDYYIYTTLNQYETLRLRAGMQARIQFRALKDGNAIASVIATISVEEILHDGVIGGDE